MSSSIDVVKKLGEMQALCDKSVQSVEVFDDGIKWSPINRDDTIWMNNMLKSMLTVLRSKGKQDGKSSGSSGGSSGGSNDGEACEFTGAECKCKGAGHVGTEQKPE